MREGENEPTIDGLNRPQRGLHFVVEVENLLLENVVEVACEGLPVLEEQRRFGVLERSFLRQIFVEFDRLDEERLALLEFDEAAVDLLPRHLDEHLHLLLERLDAIFG